MFSFCGFSFTSSPLERAHTLMAENKLHEAEKEFEKMQTDI